MGTPCWTEFRGCANSRIWEMPRWHGLKRAGANLQAPTPRSGFWHRSFELCGFGTSGCLGILLFTLPLCYFRVQNYHICRNLVRCKKHFAFGSTLNSALTFWTWLRQILISPVNDIRRQWSWEVALQWRQILFCESALCHWAVTLESRQLLCH